MTRSVDDFLGGYQPPRVTVSVTMRADLLARHAELQAKHRRTLRDDLSLSSPAQVLVDEIGAVEDEIAESEFPFTFEALGSHRYRRLLAQHPPRKDDRAERLAFNADTFPAALIAACCVDPEMDDDDAGRLVEALSDGQFTKLWNAALSVNVGDDAAPKSVRRSGTAGQNGTSSTTASPEGSLAASS